MVQLMLRNRLTELAVDGTLLAELHCEAAPVENARMITPDRTQAAGARRRRSAGRRLPAAPGAGGFSGADHRDGRRNPLRAGRAGIRHPTRYALRY